MVVFSSYSLSLFTEMFFVFFLGVFYIFCFVLSFFFEVFVLFGCCVGVFCKVGSCVCSVGGGFCKGGGGVCKGGGRVCKGGGRVCKGGGRVCESEDLGLDPSEGRMGGSDSDEQSDYTCYICFYFNILHFPI